MSSLWTPSGEHRVPRTGSDDNSSAGGGQPPPGSNGGAHDPDAAVEDLTEEVLGEPQPAEAGVSPSADEERAIRDQLAEVSEKIAAAPAEEIVTNHAYGLFELAAIHLSRRPANLTAARLAIDGFAALVEGLGDRLGSHAPSLREALSQIRLAYVQIATATSSANGSDAAPANAAPANAAPANAEPEPEPEPDEPRPSSP